MAIVRTPVLGRFALMLYRARIGWWYFREPLGRLVKWLFVSKEITNFTYDLDDANKRYLAALVADTTGECLDVVRGYMDELESDTKLRAHLERATKQSELSFIADSEIRYARRLGWYAFVRTLKPRVVVETGVDKGLGACVLTAALRRNGIEGHPGRYYGTDINPRAGYLLSDEYSNYGRILYGDSIETLKSLDESIDLFINDSDHSADYEAAEYKIVAGKLSERAVILGDNAHVTDKLLEFSIATGRRFVFFHERPREHWYPGAGIGISFKR